MRLALVGTGRMGTAVESVAADRGHEIIARFSSSHPLPEGADRPEALEAVDIMIDFSLPDLAADHIERYCRWGTAAVVGTTGWYDRLGDVAKWVKEHDAALLYAPNFSVGVAVLAHALRAVAPLIDRMPEYDPYIHEVHHVHKVDSPSGTAQMLANILVDGLERKTHVEPETQHGPIEPDALHVTSSRAGAVVGRHTVSMDSSFDEITMEHRAKDRTGFAFGSVKAAEWLPGRRGLFTIDDMLEDWMASPPK